MKQCFGVLRIILFSVVCLSAQAAGVRLLASSLDENLEIAARRSGRVLSEGTKIQLKRSMLKLSSEYGDDVCKLVREGGLEILEQGIRHGDEFWKCCKAVPGASRSLALHADELLPLTRRIVNDVLLLESKVPGSALRAVRLFGDDGIPMLARHSPEDISRFLGYAAKADSPATGKLLLETGTKSKNPSKFLDALNWKHIMAGGVSAAAIISAYQVSDGLREAVKNPAVAENIIRSSLAPVRYGLYLLLTILLFPLGIKGLCRGISVWKKRKGQSSGT